MNEKKLRVMINSNAPHATSGYSNQMVELIPQFVKHGYPLGIIDFFGLQGGIVETSSFPGVKQYPVINHMYGSDAMVLHGKDFGADVVFSLQDQWVLHPQDLQQVNRWIPITPIDYEPCPKPILQNMKYAYRIITYSKFGQKSLQDNGYYSTYIPHTVNTEIFKPMDKAERKTKAGLPADSFVLGMVAANKENPPRKSFQEVIDAFREFLKVEPKALLYIHSNPEFPGGFNFARYAEFLGIKDRVLFPDPYAMNFKTGKEEMSLIYNCMDIFLMPSISEGFGLGIIESQACGVPAIVNNFASMPELIIDGETGYKTDIAIKKWGPNESYYAIPSPRSIYDSIVKLHSANRVQMSHRCRKWITDNYDTDTVFKNKWLPYLEMLEEEVYGVAQDKKSV